jgi:SAM-dependent methyltransferase
MSGGRFSATFLEPIERYYSGKLQQHGATAAGVDWKSEASQILRFEQLLRICEAGRPFSILDMGCGYGALVDELDRRQYLFEYVGFDLSFPMIAEAVKRHGGRSCCRFTNNAAELPDVDYVVASGTFNVKLDTPASEWIVYLEESVRSMFEHAGRGVAFNLLTTYADKDRMRPDLFYADPLIMFDWCKRNLSRFVTLLHDYELFEFTMLVRR